MGATAKGRSEPYLQVKAPPAPIPLPVLAPLQSAICNLQAILTVLATASSPAAPTPLTAVGLTPRSLMARTLLTAY